MKKILTIFVFLILLIPFVSAWGWSTHSFICEQIYRTNKELNKMLDNEDFLRGCIAPDKEFEDTAYHHCYVARECKTLNISKINPGGLLYFTDLENCIEDEYFHCPALEKFEESVDKAKINNFSFWLGVSTHYITDAHVPVHQIMGEDYWSCHSPFEEMVGENLEEGKRSWDVSLACEVYFPCRLAGTQPRKCENSYVANIKFSYSDIVEVIEITDEEISKKLNIADGDYSYLLEKKPTGFLL